MKESLFTRIFKKSVPPTFSNDIDISNEGVISFFDENIKYVNFSLYGVVDSSPEIEKTILTIIRKGLIAELSYNQIGSNIYEEMNETITKEQSKSIAIHILGLAYGGSSYTSGLHLIQEGYILEKEWITSHDHKVCKSCLENERIGRIPYNQVFPSGDDFAPSKKEVNCRCTITHQIIGIRK